MKIIYISYDGMTDPLGQSQVIPYLIGLSKKGHQISLISCEKTERFKKQHQFIADLLKSNSISWHPTPYSSLPSTASKQLNLFRIKRKAFELSKKGNIDIVHCRSYMAALIGLQLKKKLGVKFIFDMRGFWADERLDGAIWSLKNKLQKRIYYYFKKKEIEFLSNADYTISLTHNAKNEILSWKEFKQQPIPIEVIPCCVDLDVFSRKNITDVELVKLKNKYQIIENNLVISYLGSIGTWYMLDEMLDFFNCLLIQKPTAKFIFITPDEESVILKKALEKNIPKEQLIIYSANRSEVATYLALSQISIYFIKPVFSKKASSPTKTGEIMALGIPIITNSGIGDSDTILTDSGAGVLINDFNSIEYHRIISQIDVLLKSDNTNIKTAAVNYFSLEKGIELYDSVYQKLAKKLTND